MSHSELHRPQAGRGFTLIELLVVVAIIALLISILLPSLSRARELARRTACAANLKSIATSCHIYADSHAGWFPTPVHNPNVGGAQAQAAMVGHNRELRDTWNPTAAVVQNNGSNMRGYFKLLLGGERAYLQPGQWICPSAPTRLSHKPRGTTTEVLTPAGIAPVYDFIGNEVAMGNAEMTEFSYSMQVTLRTTQSSNNQSGILAGIAVRNTGDSRMALGADRNPYSNSITTPPQAYRGVYGYSLTPGHGYPNPPTPDDLQGAPTYRHALTTQRRANSRNHNLDGQVVAYMDGSAAWRNNPMAGPDDDCIWTTWDPAITGPGGIVAGEPMAPPVGTGINPAYGRQRSLPTWQTDSLLLP